MLETVPIPLLLQTAKRNTEPAFRSSRDFLCVRPVCPCLPTYMQTHAEHNFLLRVVNVRIRAAAKRQNDNNTSSRVKSLFPLLTNSFDSEYHRGYAHLAQTMI